MSILQFVTSTSYNRYSRQRYEDGIMDGETVRIPCLTDECDGFIVAEFENGSPATRWEPGEPDCWYALRHERVVYHVLHGDILEADDRHLKSIEDDSTAFEKACYAAVGR